MDQRFSTLPELVEWLRTGLAALCTEAAPAGRLRIEMLGETYGVNGDQLRTAAIVAAVLSELEGPSVEDVKIRIYGSRGRRVGIYWGEAGGRVVTKNGSHK